MKYHEHDNHSQQIGDLLELGVRTTLVTLDAHHDLWEYQQEVIQRTELDACWLKLAIDERLVDKVYWVVPDPLYNECDFVGSIKYLSKTLGTTISETSIGYVLIHNGVEINVLPLDNLPIQRGIVLSIDLDYLGEFEDEWWVSGNPETCDGWIEPKVVAEKLREKIIDPIAVSVFESSGYIDIRIRGKVKELGQLIRVMWG